MTSSAAIHRAGRLPRMKCAVCDYAAHHVNDIAWHDKNCDFDKLHAFTPKTEAAAAAIVKACADVAELENQLRRDTAAIAAELHRAGFDCEATR